MDDLTRWWRVFRNELIIFFLLVLSAPTAHAKIICTTLAGADEAKIPVIQGDCGTRVSPASTFKIAISLMGFDSGFLEDEHSPTLPYVTGYPDWGGSDWRQPTDPARWIKYSVVWFSQQVTHALGELAFEQYVVRFGYGNSDVSGDPGKHNGLDRAWISSSLKISPLEQVGFLKGLVNRRLPVSRHAFEETERITEVAMLPSGWKIHGKTERPSRET